MIDIPGKFVLVEAMKEFVRKAVDAIIGRRGNHIDRVALTEALLSMQEAIQKTRKFIDANGYQPNEDLQEVWRNVLRNCTRAHAGNHFPDWLFHKIEFWGNPQQWIDNPKTLEFVPQLSELYEECKMLLQELK